MEGDALYVDTDSAIYVATPGSHELSLGPLLGDLTNELSCYGDDAYIKCFVSGGPKFYSFIVRKPDGTECSVCKVKGIRMNFKNTEIVNFDSIRQLIDRTVVDADEAENTRLHVSEMGIRRTCFHDVISRPEK